MSRRRFLPALAFCLAGAMAGPAAATTADSATPDTASAVDAVDLLPEADVVDDGVGSDGVQDADVMAADDTTGDGVRAARVPRQPVCPGAMEDARWFDRAQMFWSERACAPAVWFDRFFGGGRTGDVASALVRVIPSVQYSDRDFDEVGVRLKARVSLPQVEKRMSLILNEDDEAESGLLPGEVERPQQANAPDRSSSVALRYLFQQAATSRLDFDLGLRSEMKLLAQIRYRRVWSHRPGLQTRFTQAAYFRDGEGFGERSLVEVERMLAEDMLLRWSTQATVSEEVNGLELREGIQLLRQIDRDRAISWNTAMGVRSDPAWKAVEYVTSVRYRQRVFRSWIFYEVEPFIDWIRDDRFNTNPGIAFRVELWLGDTRGDRRTAPPAAPSASPADVPVDVPADAPAPTSPTSDVPTAAP